MSRSESSPAGRVVLVGAGPGAPDLITLRGERALRAADVVVYDALATTELLGLARPDAECIDVGRRGHESPALTQDDINAILIERAREGRQVVRLKGGDPFVFGRGGEEVTACQEAGIPVEVVPGVSSAIAGPGAAGIPVTDRRFATSFAVVTGHRDPTRQRAEMDLAMLARSVDTLVVLMGMRNLEEIVASLLAGGRDPEMPAAVVMNATLPDEQVLCAPLSLLVKHVRDAGLAAPAVLVVGDVARLHDPGAWRAALPLAGMRVLVTRTPRQADAWARALRVAGAEPVCVPMISIEPVLDAPGLARALAGLADYDAVLLTSANAARELAARARERGVDLAAAPRALCVGPASAEAAREAGLEADALRGRTDAEAMLRAILGRGAVAGRRFLLPRTERAREVLPDGLREAGAVVDEVVVYRTRAADFDAAALRAGLSRGDYDALTFASPSAVRPFAAALDPASREACARTQIVAIGPVTAGALREAGLEPDVVPERAETGALLAALARARAGGGRR